MVNAGCASEASIQPSFEYESRETLLAADDAVNAKLKLGGRLSEAILTGNVEIAAEALALAEMLGTLDMGFAGADERALGAMTVASLQSADFQKLAMTHTFIRRSGIRHETVVRELMRQASPAGLEVVPRDGSEAAAQSWVNTLYGANLSLLTLGHLALDVDGEPHPNCVGIESVVAQWIEWSDMPMFLRPGVAETIGLLRMAAAEHWLVTQLQSDESTPQVRAASFCAAAQMTEVVKLSSDIVLTGINSQSDVEALAALEYIANGGLQRDRAARILADVLMTGDDKDMVGVAAWATDRRYLFTEDTIRGLLYANYKFGGTVPEGVDPGTVLQARTVACRDTIEAIARQNPTGNATDDAIINSAVNFFEQCDAGETEEKKVGSQ